MKKVAIVGAGPAGLMAADVISAAAGRNVRISIYDRMPSVGRKFLMAGRGGLNLTHSEPLEAFVSRYGDRAATLRAAIEAFPPEAVRTWSEALAQPTFVGTSGRVFPRSMKTSPLLRAWLRQLGERGIELHTRHRWTEWDENGNLTFETPTGAVRVEADATILALGGASWPGLGSDAAWVPLLREAGVQVAPLAPSNCGFTAAWSDVFRTRFEGQPLKRIAVAHDGQSVRGEAIIAASGIEGGAIYALSPSIRDAVLRDGAARITIDLRPDSDVEALTRALAKSRGKQSLSTFLRKSSQLTPPAIGLLQEAAHSSGLPLARLKAGELAALIKNVPIDLTGLAPISRAISSCGGVSLAEIDQQYMLSKRPGVFIAGEMLDWEAPTGGYLLQACFSTGAAAGRGVLGRLNLD